jgi:transcriptional regulator with XRE-family HTH domain
MTAEELIELRSRLGWDRTRLAGRLGISPSRLADFESGRSRGKGARPAPIPKAIELACRWLDEHEIPQRPLTPAQRAALWRDDASWPQAERVLDDRRNGLYGYLPGGRRY